VYYGGSFQTSRTAAANSPLTFTLAACYTPPPPPPGGCVAAPSIDSESYAEVFGGCASPTTAYDVTLDVTGAAGAAAAPSGCTLKSDGRVGGNGSLVYACSGVPRGQQTDLTFTVSNGGAGSERPSPPSSNCTRPAARRRALCVRPGQQARCVPAAASPCQPCSPPTRRMLPLSIAGCAASDSANVTVAPPAISLPTLTPTPTSATVCAGSAKDLAFAVTSSPALTEAQASMLSATLTKSGGFVGSYANCTVSGPGASFTVTCPGLTVGAYTLNLDLADAAYPGAWSGVAPSRYQTSVPWIWLRELPSTPNHHPFCLYTPPRPL
jgi:hypothetical protein